MEGEPRSSLHLAEIAPVTTVSSIRFYEGASLVELNDEINRTIRRETDRGNEVISMSVVPLAIADDRNARVAVFFCLRKPPPL
jgi:hypothetical protein